MFDSVACFRGRGLRDSAFDFSVYRRKLPTSFESYPLLTQKLYILALMEEDASLSPMSASKLGFLLNGWSLVEDYSLDALNLSFDYLLRASSLLATFLLQ